MLELALKGSKGYCYWLLGLALVIGAGVSTFIYQCKFGLGITGLSRDISWGFYVAQLTFLVGVAASAVMVVLPYYLHNYKEFGKLTILGEFTAVAAVSMCGLFLFVDIGQPMRAFNVFLYPSPQSMVFWDSIVLIGYLFINIIVGWNVIEAERNNVKPQFWVYPLIYLSIPWAFAIHTVTAFLYSGLAARGFWLTAVMAPRFLASAFAAGPAFLILLCFVIRKFAGFDPGKAPIQSLAKIIVYALIANLFFLGCEVFVAFYSKIPEHMDHLTYLYFGLAGHSTLVPWMWTALGLMLFGLIILIIPITRRNETVLSIACLMVFT
ncbi:MAG: polysulfide reductase NrfD, partial [Desulfobacterales bacterium]|nr:polysulfide reductase NrfD [Desulfobacterales bacterium]